MKWEKPIDKYSDSIFKSEATQLISFFIFITIMIISFVFIPLAKGILILIPSFIFLYSVIGFSYIALYSRIKNINLKPSIMDKYLGYLLLSFYPILTLIFVFLGKENMFFIIAVLVAFPQVFIPFGLLTIFHYKRLLRIYERFKCPKCSRPCAYQEKNDKWICKDCGITLSL
jgi:hypothetical protein